MYKPCKNSRTTKREKTITLQVLRCIEVIEQDSTYSPSFNGYWQNVLIPKQFRVALLPVKTEELVMGQIAIARAQDTQVGTVCFTFTENVSQWCATDDG